MEKLKILVSATAAIVPLIVATLTFLIKMIKSVKNGKIEHTNRLWIEFCNEAVEYVEVLKGKQNGDLKGETKKEIAMNKVESLCVKNKIPFEYDKISAIIESVVELTKKVNMREKDKPSLPTSEQPVAI